MISSIQKVDKKWSQVVPVTTEVQQVSSTVTKYTSVVQKEEVKEEVVVLYNSETKHTEVITSHEVKPEVKPYYVT